MKKLLVSAFLLFSAVTIFAQENQESNEKSIWNSFDAGAYIVNGYAAGPLADYITGTLGMGIAVDYKTPLPFLGVRGTFDVEGGFVKRSDIDSLCNVSLGGGAWAEFPYEVGGATLSVRPEFDYGLIFEFISSSKSNVKSSYVDQFFELACVVRYAPLKLQDLGLNFEAAPFFKFCPQDENVANYIGIRLGCFYDGKHISRLFKKQKNNA